MRSPSTVAEPSNVHCVPGTNGSQRFVITVDVAKCPSGKTSVTASSPPSAGLSGRNSLGAADGVTDAGARDGDGEAVDARGVAVAPATPPVGLGVFDAEQAASETTHATAAMRDTNRRAATEGLQSLTASPRTAPAPPILTPARQ